MVHAVWRKQVGIVSEWSDQYTLTESKGGRVFARWRCYQHNREMPWRSIHTDLLSDPPPLHAWFTFSFPCQSDKRGGVRMHSPDSGSVCHQRHSRPLISLTLSYFQSCLWSDLIQVECDFNQVGATWVSSCPIGINYDPTWFTALRLDSSYSDLIPVDSDFIQVDSIDAIRVHSFL